MRIAALTAAALLSLLPGIARATERAALEAQAKALETRWAPVFEQSVSGDHPERDRPLPVDFDGDWDATNNWRHLTPAHRSTRAAVYGSAILSETHAYLTYTLFFPRDWATPLCVSLVCHDNDLETVLVVVERPSASQPSGKLVLVESKAHRGYASATAGELALDSTGRPVLAVESEGHGIYPIRAHERLDDEARVRFVPPEHPQREAEGAEPYGLLSLHDTLWAQRRPSAGAGKTWIAGESGFLGYRGARLGRRGDVLGISMAHSEYTGGVRPPWGVEAAPGARGDWFLDPAFVAIGRHAQALGSNGTASTSYVLNPFLDELTNECADAACKAPPDPPVSGWHWSGLGAALVAVGLVSPRRAFASLARAKSRLARR